MLRLREIALYQFKNYTHQQFSFASSVIGICGLNGVGKTSLLDAIHYLGFTKSYFTRLDSNAVKQGCKGFRIEGKMEANGEFEKVACILRETGKKEVLINEVAHEKLSHHIGRYPVVVIAPDDASLVTGESKERRTFLDQLLSQLDSSYLQALITYNRLLQQRNSLLKELNENNSHDFSLLEVLNEQLLHPGNYIHEKRKELAETLFSLVISIYREIAQPNTSGFSTEEPQLFYQSSLNEEKFSTLLSYNQKRDIQAQRTTKGIHRDEIEIQLNQQPFRIMASQGQRKSLLFALKLAEMEIITHYKGFPPLLLLDDVFEKLDEQRISNLLKKVCSDSRGQIFITDTNADRLQRQLDLIGITHQLIEL